MTINCLDVLFLSTLKQKHKGWLKFSRNLAFCWGRLSRPHILCKAGWCAFRIAHLWTIFNCSRYVWLTGKSKVRRDDSRKGKSIFLIEKAFEHIHNRWGSLKTYYKNGWKCNVNAVMLWMYISHTLAVLKLEFGRTAKMFAAGNTTSVKARVALQSNCMISA